MNTASRASAHYVISRDGTIENLVPDEDAAWHVRREAIHQTTPQWNFRSIGIELTDDRMENGWMTDEEYRKLLLLTKVLIQRWGIPIDRKHIKMHSELDAKTDPKGWTDISMEHFIADVKQLFQEDEVIDYSLMEQSTFQAMAKAKGADVRAEWIKKNPGKNIYEDFCKKFFFRDANGGLLYKTATASTWINDMATFYILGGVDGQWTQL